MESYLKIEIFQLMYKKSVISYTQIAKIKILDKIRPLCYNYLLHIVGSYTKMAILEKFR